MQPAATASPPSYTAFASDVASEVKGDGVLHLQLLLWDEQEGMEGMTCEQP